MLDNLMTGLALMASAESFMQFSSVCWQVSLSVPFRV